jgi:hypothetical protein
MASKPPRVKEATSFLNVDLDVEARDDLSVLVDALGPSVYDLHTGRVGRKYQTHLELASSPRRTHNAEAVVARFVTLLLGLPPRARRLWNSATRRDFNIGIQGGTMPHAFEFALAPDTLQAVAKLGARVVVTIYAVDANAVHKRPHRRTRRY